MADCPPTFFLQAGDDPADDVLHSMKCHLALQQPWIPVELHLYPHGVQAFGVRMSSTPLANWPSLRLTRLNTISALSDIGFVPAELERQDSIFLDMRPGPPAPPGVRFRPEADIQDVVRLSTTTLALDCCDQLIDSCCRVYDQLRLVGYAPLCKLTSKLQPKVPGP